VKNKEGKKKALAGIILMLRGMSKDKIKASKMKKKCEDEEDEEE
jgi:hypothetical protein